MTESPAWARGIDMAFLKNCAALYRAEFKAHTYGAFGLPKERDIADARAANQLMWTNGPDFKPAAVAIVRNASLASSHSDFAGRQARIEPGDIFVRSIAGRADGNAKLIAKLALMERPIWIEGHVENEALVTQLQLLGFSRVMTKISASSDLKAMWLRANHLEGRLPPALDPSDEPGVKVLREDFVSPVMLGAIDAELKAIGAGDWAQHYSNYNKRSSWTSFALAGYDQDDPNFIIKPAEMSKDWKAKNPARMIAACLPTIMAKKFPAAMRIVDRIPGRKQRVRFMRLGAGGGELSRHSDITDPEAGTRDGQIARLHIPIHTDPRCLFRSWGLDGAERRLHFPARALCYIDTRKPHAVVNPSEVERVHLVIDTYSGPELRRLIAG